jgi:hypothetical protein
MAVPSEILQLLAAVDPPISTLGTDGILQLLLPLQQLLHLVKLAGYPQAPTNSQRTLTLQQSS